LKIAIAILRLIDENSSRTIYIVALVTISDAIRLCWDYSGLAKKVRKMSTPANSQLPVDFDMCVS